MNEQQVKAFAKFLQENALSLNDLYQALSGPKPGDIYFTDNSYFTYPLPGKTAKGVFVTPYCYVTNVRSSDRKGYTKGKIFCFMNSVSMPSSSERDSMVKNRTAINTSLRSIGFQTLPYGEFWADGDSSYEEGCVDTVMDASGEVGGDFGVREVYRRGPKIEKQVCGVLKCSAPAARRLETIADASVQPEPKDFMLENPLNALLKALGLCKADFHDYCQGKTSCPRPGEYLLKNGYCASHPEYGQEAGIYINANMYVPLNDAYAQVLTRKEANAYAKAVNRSLPEYFEIRQLAKVTEAFNRALEAVGMKDHAVTGDILQTCWYKGVPADSSPRRLIFIEKNSNVPDTYLAMQDIMENWGIKSF